ncbi:MAG TPA: hypothetical protein EYQ12_03305 [Oceanospirillaceae bacterium]|nr:hypothetical protein [Oceanospirillaceae bacterium]
MCSQPRLQEDACADDYEAIAFQGRYTMELMAKTDYPAIDLEDCNQAFYQWKKHKKLGIMTFRNHGYKSALTGKTAPPHHTPWKDALDDSLESYLGDS